MSKAYDDMLALAKAEPHTRRHLREVEHQTQCACVKWFRLQFPKMAHSLFAVPNGGRRDPTTAAKLKREGVLAGVADLIFLQRNSRHGALLIEMKTTTGRQRESQRRWQQLVELDGYKYMVCRSIEDFIRTINDYLNDKI